MHKTIMEQSFSKVETIHRFYVKIHFSVSPPLSIAILGVLPKILLFLTAFVVISKSGHVECMVVLR